MDFKVKYRLSKCDKDTYFYDLYVNGIWVCGYYSIECIKRRITHILRTGRYDLKGLCLYETLRKV